MTTATSRLKLFTTCPVATLTQSHLAIQRLAEVARWSESAGCEGMLVYSDNSQLDPWLVSQIVIGATQKLSPLVAVQPAYMHPYSVAKMISSLAFLHNRRVYLNMIAGGFKHDLLALNDKTPHDDRYARLIEYTTIIQQLTESAGPVSFEGTYYTVKNLKLAPALSPELQPGILVSGSSPAGREAADQLGAIGVEYPKPSSELAPRADENGPSSGLSNGPSNGIRIGLIVRDDESEAWSIAHERYPIDRKGQITRQLANKVSDSHWHHQLAELGSGLAPDSPYWLVPFESYKTMCPYLVGSYDRVASEIARYVESGYTTFILDEPPDAAEMEHIGVAFQRAEQRCLAQ